MTLRPGLSLTARCVACVVICTMCGGCYPCLMFWHALTNVGSSTHDLTEPALLLKTDAFLLARDGKLELARPGARWGVPGSSDGYRRCSFLYPGVKAVVAKGTRLRRLQREYHGVGYIFWTVDHAEIVSGPHAGKKVKLVGFQPKETLEGWCCIRSEDPNPDWLEHAPPSENGHEPTTRASGPAQATPP
jgi:hypothetical protein